MQIYVLQHQNTAITVYTRV